MKKKNELLFLTLAAVFIAIIAVMTFSPLGYLKVGVIEITFLVIPVVAGGIVLGKWGGLLLGTAFGLTSLFQCFGFSPFGAALLAVSPVRTAIVCLVPRMLLGFLAAWLFEALAKTRLPVAASSALCGLCASLINTVGFVGLLILLFSRSAVITDLMAQMGTKNVLYFALLFAGVNSLAEAAANTVVGAALGPVMVRLEKSVR